MSQRVLEAVCGTAGLGETAILRDRTMRIGRVLSTQALRVSFPHPSGICRLAAAAESMDVDRPRGGARKQKASLLGRWPVAGRQGKMGEKSCATAASGAGGRGARTAAQAVPLCCCRHSRRLAYPATLPGFCNSCCRAAASRATWISRTACRGGSLSLCQRTRAAPAPQNVSPRKLRLAGGREGGRETCSNAAACWCQAAAAGIPPHQCCRPNQAARPSPRPRHVLVCSCGGLGGAGDGGARGGAGGGCPRRIRRWVPGCSLLTARCSALVGSCNCAVHSQVSACSSAGQIWRAAGLRHSC